MATKKQITAKIWTTELRPFAMGGNPNHPIFTIVPVLERKRMKGIEFFSFTTPPGTLRICEATTGGIIADTWEGLADNIKGVPKAILMSQINVNRPAASQAEELTNEDFFKVYKY